MKKMRFKGFTLVECLIALAILGIASLIMAQIYANVSRMNRSNHNINTSLSYQMKYVEKSIEADSIIIYPDGGTTSTPDTSTEPPHKLGKLTNVKITSSYGSKYSYSYPVDIRVLLSRDAKNNVVADKEENQYDLRYKYLVGHQN
ncbi:MAG: prepilin-type N-terminal cleavage/methylation domain-containing protein [Oscillospiraceae bacterium]|nr:prepilin-type N-terminal cleavage/methylation domain-containing protein [Oscillospiraceae bacterium]